MRGTRKGTWRPSWVFSALLLAFPMWGCLDDDGNPIDVQGDLVLEYLGTDACAACHADIVSTFIKSGHPYKLNKVEDGKAPFYPFSTVPAPPAGYSWSDISYVIGGYGWKARFIGLDGYIITDGGQNQYNLATEGWVDYHKDERVPYDCGPCHMTAYSPVGNQDGLEGLIGTWEAPGVQCEECHGPGSLHALNPGGVDMTTDTRADACGKCHNRGGYNTTIPASGGFTKHHEQGNEHLNSPHAELNCVTCHDPHVTAVYQGAPGIRAECVSCHAEAGETFSGSPLAQQHSGVECIDCHMPKSAKSALAFGPYEGDIRSHLIQINSSADAEQFSEDGSTTNPYVTTEFACLNCHEDQDKEWAEAGAALVHGSETPLSSAYVGSDQCQACHQDYYDKVFDSAHPYKLNKVVNGQPPTYPFSTVPAPPAGVTWDDVSYVIGGYGWKARFIGLDGYIITAGGQNQWNLATEGWVDYHKDEIKPYDCGTCHTTGYSPDGHQDGLEGLIGTWSEPGVGCEACHGPGAAHIQIPTVVPMTVDTRSDACGSCHNRGGYNTTIPASGGFTKHHEQGNEHLNSPHKAVNCVTCHDPHTAVVYAEEAGVEPVRAVCESCHDEATGSFNESALAQQHAAVECIDCHMPKSAKSALAFGPYEGDIRSHLIQINPSADAEQFSEDGSTTNPYVTTEFACLNCHDDRDKAWAEAGAAVVHKPDPPLSSAYVGSDQCQACHQDYYDKVFDSGHPYKLNKVVNGQPPTYPFSTVPAPPAGVTWADVSYVIGGYGWKARFIGLDGFIITAGGQNQWNLATEGWVDYHKDEIKPYDCGICHTTGYSLEGNQDGLPGLIGTWSEPGVGCEACHGPGAAHIQSPDVVEMTVDTRADACGECHNRGGYNTTIPASGGFTKHHEQGNEHLNSPHKDLNCVTCHDPHTSVLYSDQKGIEPIRVECESCHAEATESWAASSIKGAMENVGCIDCHMPKSAKSALAFGDYEGDIRSHLIKINPAADAEPFSPDGTTTNPYVTTEFACLNCHGDETKDWAEAGAALVHGPATPLSSAYVGSDQCQACHQDNYSDVFASGHPYKLNKVVDGQPPTYPFSTVPAPPAGVTWDDVSYVIGGYGWKARFIGLDGFIITAGGQNQWNLLTETWTDYHTDEVKPYDCGTCHTTGYSPEGHQDGLPGLIGTWSEPGVGCEACHGPGAAHIQNPGVVAMTVDTRAEACGSCHNRGGVNSTIPASGGFIKHHEQYNEMANSSHIQLSCLSCHDPHKATRWRGGVGPGGAPAQFAGTGPHRIGGVSVDCEGCHTDARASLQANLAADDHGDSTCESCHMPPMTKSAVALGTYEGDVATHMWKINTSATAEPFSPDGTVASGFLTTEFSCLRSGCHTDKDKAWAEVIAEDLHGAGFSAVGALTVGGGG